MNKIKLPFINFLDKIRTEYLFAIQKSNNKFIILFLGVTMLMLLSSLVWFKAYLYDRIEEFRIHQEQTLKDEIVHKFRIILNENIDKAKIHAEWMKKYIKRQIDERYFNQGLFDQLKEDIHNPKTDSILSLIFLKAIKNVYMNNIENDNNDPWIANLFGIIFDKSKNCAISEGTLKEWNTEWKLHYNPELAQKAIKAIINQDDRIIFWEFLSPENIKEHKLITELNVKELTDLIKTKGICAIKTYEFLVPVYIEEDKDLFGATYC